jgi:hypothetical protein
MLVCAQQCELNLYAILSNTMPMRRASGVPIEYEGPM